MRLTITGLKKCTDMKKILFIAFSIMAFVFGANAQEDTELNMLVDIVKSLKSGGTKAHKEAIRILSEDNLWTIMDEATDRSSESRIGDVDGWLRLNSALKSSEENERRQVSTGNFLNGADPRYNYSLIEKTIKGNATSTFTLNNRWGSQTFVVIPYKGTSETLSVEVPDNESFSSVRTSDGSIKLTGNAVKGKTLTLKVTNNGKENTSYVIINHNSRK